MTHRLFEYETLPGSYFLAIFSSNLLADVCCSISKIVNHISDHVSSDFWYPCFQLTSEYFRNCRFASAFDQIWFLRENIGKRCYTFCCFAPPNLSLLQLSYKWSPENLKWFLYPFTCEEIYFSRSPNLGKLFRSKVLRDSKL